MRLTGDRDDLITALIVFGRRDYGDIPAGGVVLEIGAHLGAFALDAASRGARIVYSFEPDPELFDTLLDNVARNEFSSRVVASRTAGVGTPAPSVRFHREANASGHIEAGSEEGSVICVRASTLAEVLIAHGIECVDLLNLDCEGSEYDIIFHEHSETWNRIKRVRLEYHHGRVSDLKQKFSELGFRLAREVAYLPTVGLLWFDRPQ